MDIEYRKLSEKELDLFIEMRIKQLREEGAKEDFDLKPALRDYYVRHMKDVGKAAAVVVMVIQIAGSGGTYPIETLPEIYQKIYIFFPFPYAINAMRETIGGMYGSDYMKYLGELLLFAVAALLIGLVIRLPFVKINHFVEKRMEDTEMM